MTRLQLLEDMRPACCEKGVGCPDRICADCAWASEAYSKAMAPERPEGFNLYERQQGGYLETLDRMQRFQALLADRRIKRDTDYCMASKFGQVHVCCGFVWTDSIKEAAETARLTLTTLQSWA